MDCDENDPLSQQFINIYDTHAGIDTARYITSHKDINYISFSPDGQMVACAGSDDNTSVYDLRFGAKELCILRHERPSKQLNFAINIVVEHYSAIYIDNF